MMPITRVLTGWLLLAGSVLAARASAAQAAPARVAHLSGQAVLAILPTYLPAQAELAAYAMAWQVQLSELPVRCPPADTTCAGRSARAQQRANQAIAQRQQALLQPLREQIRQAVAAVAEAQGYDYVLDDDTGQWLYVRPGAHQLLPAVRAYLGRTRP